MILRYRLKTPSFLMPAGLSFLVLGTVSNLCLRPVGILSQNAVHFVTGLFYGIGIGMLLLNLLVRRGGGSTGSACAR